MKIWKITRFGEVAQDKTAAVFPEEKDPTFSSVSVDGKIEGRRG